MYCLFCLLFETSLHFVAQVYLQPRSIYFQNDGIPSLNQHTQGQYQVLLDLNWHLFIYYFSYISFKIEMASQDKQMFLSHCLQTALTLVVTFRTSFNAVVTMAYPPLEMVSRDILI